MIHLNILAARKSAIFLLAGLTLFILVSLGIVGRGWAAVETVKTFGLVEKEGIMEPLSGGNGTADTSATPDDVQIVQVNDSVSPGDVIVGPGTNEILDTAPSGDDVLVGGPFTESDTFNDGSVVYVRVNVGTYHKDSFPTVIVKEDGAVPLNQITITVYDNGYLPDEDNNDTYHWGKFILQQGPGPSSGTTLQLSDGETATITADLDSGGDAGTTTITADYDDGSGEAPPVDHSDHIPPVMNLSINPGTFSPDGDGVQDTAAISFTLYDNVSSSLYTRVEIRDDSSDHIIKRNLLIPSSADNPLSTGSYSYIWDGKDDSGNLVPDATYVVYLLSVDDAENSAQRTAEVIVETTKPEIIDIVANPSPFSPENGDGNYDTSIITFTATNAGAELTFEIYAEPACTTLVRDLTSSVQLVSGVDHYSVTWNGKDGNGVYVDDGTYTCKIYAESHTGENEENMEGTVTIDNTAPSAPTNLNATAVSGGGIKLTWTASSSGDAAQYNIYRATTSQEQKYTNPTYTVSVGTNAYTDTSTSDGATYYYVARTEDSLGNIETNTDEVSATASASGPSFSSITADKSAYKNGETIILTVTLANHDASCTITADFSNIDDQYVSGGESVVNWGTDAVDNDGDGHKDNPGEQGIYVITYLISMVNSRTDSSYNIPVTATNAAENSTTRGISLTLDNIPLPAPTNLSATALSGGGIELTWTASSSNGVSQYNIYRTTTSGEEDYTSPPTYTVLVGTNSYTDTSTTPGVTYYYVVRAQDSAGNTETNTNEVSATAGIPDTTAPPPPYFGISSFDSTTGKIVISGTTGADASQPQEVEIFLNGSSQGTTVADANGDFTTENFTPGIILVSGHNFITVQATDKVGNKGSLSAPLKLNYKPQNLLSIVIRSTHVVSSGSSTKPIKVFYSVSQSALVTICIYNLKGELVKEWSQSVTPGGEPSWSWFGKNMYEENVNNGVYILRITARAGSESETVTKLVGVLR